MTNLLDFKNNIDLLVPVPLHKKRKRKRGYNQSALLCNAISRTTDIPVNEISLQRVKNTISQTKFNLVQRRKNVADAFRVVNKKEIVNKTILLVDDVITSGSTINACAEQLKINGAKEIFAITVAKA
jgi:ComF family protein